MFKAKKIRRSLFLQSFLFRSIIDFLYARYFVILVPSFKFIVVIIMSFSVISKKLFSHRNHLSFLVSNLVHQLVWVFCSHPVKVNLGKRLVHSISHLQAQQHVPYRSRICVHMGEKSSSFSTGHSLLILELPQEFVCLVESGPSQSNNEDVIWSWRPQQRGWALPPITIPLDWGTRFLVQKLHPIAFNLTFSFDDSPAKKTAKTIITSCRLGNHMETLYQPYPIKSRNSQGSLEILQHEIQCLVLEGFMPRSLSPSLIWLTTLMARASVKPCLPKQSKNSPTKHRAKPKFFCILSVTP